MSLSLWLMMKDLKLRRQHQHLWLQILAHVSPKTHSYNHNAAIKIQHGYNIVIQYGIHVQISLIGSIMSFRAIFFPGPGSNPGSFQEQLLRLSLPLMTLTFLRSIGPFCWLSISLRLCAVSSFRGICFWQGCLGRNAMSLLLSARMGSLSLSMVMNECLVEWVPSGLVSFLITVFLGCSLWGATLASLGWGLY